MQVKVGHIALLAIFCTLLGCTVESKKNDSKEIENIVDSYFERNPQSLQRALNRLARHQLEQNEISDSKSLSALTKDIYSIDAGTFYGNKSPRSIVIFSDYKCAFCRKAHEKIVNEGWIEKYNIRIIIRELPVLGKDSHKMALFAITNARKSEYGATHSRIFSTGSSPDFSRFSDTSFADAEIKKNMELARKLNITGTPAFVINGNIIRGFNEGDIRKSLEEL